MPSIAIIDDNLDQSDTLKIALKQYLENLKNPLQVITQFPFRDIDKYFDFIDRNDVCVLILDERLNNQSTDREEPVDYKGNELVSIIRQRYKDFPIFSVTTYSDDDDLNEKFSEFEYIIKRDDFVEEGNKYVPIILRAAQRFLESNLQELDEYSRLTKEIASGDTDPEKIQKLKALQVKLELPISGFEDRQAWLNKYEQHIKELEELKEKLEAKLTK